MERLTKTYADKSHGAADNLLCGENSWEYKGLLIKKLGKYEDTGLEPEEIEVMKNNGGWIPVSERLPEVHEESEDILDSDTLAVIDTRHHLVSDLVFVTLYDEEADKFFTNNDCLCDGEWCNFGDTFDVIAWQPLPEPYRPQE